MTMAEKTYVANHKNESETTSREETRAPERYAVPAVDILEGAHGLTLVADLPGVSREALTIDVDQGVLTIEGRSNGAPPAEEIYREFTWPHFYRQFRIPEGIDVAKVGAAFCNGVLTLTLPRMEATKPRRIKITPGE
jgi:HSP20 family protein